MSSRLSAVGLVVTLLASQVLSAETVEVTFRFDPADLVWRAVGGYDTPELKGCDLPFDAPGTPQLPVRFANVLVPAGSKVTRVTAAAEESLVREDVLVYPTQIQHPMSAPPPGFTEPDPAVYGSDAWFPAERAVLTGVHNMRGHTFASVRLNPLRYTPASRKLYMAGTIVLTVEFERQDVMPVGGGRSIPRHPSFTDAVSRVVVNPGLIEEDLALEQPMPVGDTVDYLIITNTTLAPACEPLKAHRESFNGFTVEIKTISQIQSAYSGLRPDGGSDNQTRIRRCIQDYVANKGTQYVLLVGDNTIVGQRPLYIFINSKVYNIPGDIYYSGLDDAGYDDIWDKDGNFVYGEASTIHGAEGDLAPDVWLPTSGSRVCRCGMRTR